MALETRLALKTTQKLVMTTMLQQAIKLLPLSRLELVQKIQQEILENPLLEELATQESSEVERIDEEKYEDEKESDPETEIDWEMYLQNSGGDFGSLPEVDREAPSLEATLKSETSLTEHLLWQFALTVRDELDKTIGTYLIGNIDDSGYLECQVEEVAPVFDVENIRVAKVLELIQTLDPPGVGARDLRECLLIQLRQLDMEDSLASRIVEKHLVQIDERYFQRIAKSLNVSLEEVVEAVKCIRELDPSPGSRYTQTNVEYVTPDVFIVKIGDDYQIMLNDDGMPRLRINGLYQGALRHRDGISGETRDYLEDKIRSAMWLIKSIEQRRQTLLRVAKSLCKFQREFLDNGVAFLKPLVLKDVADDIGMHESTVSRVTTNKYVHTPQGVYELKFFFHSGLESFDGDTLSSVSVKDVIRKAVTAENIRDPLTDQQVVDLLEKQGIKIARRTVAKYRQELRIAPANRRKRMFSS